MSNMEGRKIWELRRNEELSSENGYFVQRKRGL